MSEAFNTSRFRDLAPNWNLQYFEETDSTNTQAKLKLEESPTTTPTLLLAEHQTNGRGRRENNWDNSRGKDLLFTAVIHSNTAPSEIHKVATASALAIAETLQGYNLNPKIKLPNDIYLDGKKAAGILIEQHGHHTLLGIGINVNSTPKIENSTSLYSQGQKRIHREDLLAKLLDQLLQKLELCQHHYAHLARAFQALDLLYGKAISYQKDGTTHYGTARGISPHGYILVDHGYGPIEMTSGHNFRPISNTSPTSLHS